MITPDVNQTIELLVDVSDPQLHSNILLNKDHRYRLMVSPANQTWNENRLNVTAAGSRNPKPLDVNNPLRKPDSPWMALIAGIEGEENLLTEVGLGITNFQPAESGELICFANDMPGNSSFQGQGSIRLKLTRLS